MNFHNYKAMPRMLFEQLTTHSMLGICDSYLSLARYVWQVFWYFHSSCCLSLMCLCTIKPCLPAFLFWHHACEIT